MLTQHGFDCFLSDLNPYQNLSKISLKSRKKVNYLSGITSIMKKVKILPIYLSFLILIYILFVIIVNLSSFPRLHGDEAWFGLNASKIIHHCFD